MRSNTPRPSLNALRAFEATARLASMSAAADELYVTHGAVSRHIRALEDQLGVILLNRGSHATEPTPEGRRLADGLSTAFRLIQASVEELKPGPLTLSCSASIMMYWLIPRIASFHEKNPEIELQFNMNYDRIDFVRDNITVALRVSAIDPPRDAHVRELETETVGPVCSPEYMKANRLKQPKDLLRARLLGAKTRPDAWREWLEAVGGGIDEVNVAESYEHFYLQIQAAVCGLGVANVPKMLVLDDLRSGKLVAPFGFVPSRRKLVLWIAPHMDGRADVEALAQWLALELRETETGALA